MKTKPKATKKKSPAKSGKTQKKDFPGYPLYPSREDITHHAKKTQADLEDPTHPEAKGNAHPKPMPLDEPNDTPKNEFDITDEDLEALGPKDLSMDMGEDEELKHRASPVDFAGDDMDVPGSEDDDASEATGNEDEENNSYSIGGDRHNDLEEDPS